jgi:hypothetical protein
MRTLATICILLIAVPSIAQSGSLALKGIVLRPDGQPLEGAFVLIRDYQRTDATNAEYVSDR